MRVLPVFCALAVLPLRADPLDPVDLMRRAASAFDENRIRAINYLYRESVTIRQVDKKAKIVSQNSRTFEIVYLEGETYPKLVARDGKPLSAGEERAEETKLREETMRRQGKPLRARLVDRVPSRDRAQIAYHRIPDLHRIRYEGTEMLDNRPVWILSAEPDPEIHPGSEIDNYTHSMKLRLWIDQESLLFHRVEAVSLRAAWKRPAGNRLEIEFVPFDSQVWLVRRVYQRAPLDPDDRPAVFQDTEQIYTDFRRFQADSKLVPIE